ncbi:MAG TPA: hypothetical protein DFR83_23515 [Deltaproteobacteria bacterium]|nr:hypothetical protein [Deltaproteobacteria bacterium]
MGALMSSVRGAPLGGMALCSLLACSGSGVPSEPAVDASLAGERGESLAQRPMRAGSLPSPPDEEGADDTEDPNPLALCVNEWVASNMAGLRLADGTRPDWLELHNPGEEDVALDGWMIGDSEDPLDAEPFDASLVVPAGGELVLFADGRTELGPRHLDMGLDADGEAVALFAPDGRGDVVLYGAVDPDLAVARTSDCCRGEGCWEMTRLGSPGVGNTDGGDRREVLIAAGTEWRYLDTNVEPDASWTQVAFDDSSWARGSAPLGFGDGHHVGTLYGGPDGARHISTWFREAFFVGDAPALHHLELDLMVDDGARLWLNGVEVLRVNLPADTEITTLTLSVVPVDGISESARIRYAIDGTMLVTGINVLAVEVHQDSSNSPDLGLDVQLTALRL